MNIKAFFFVILAIGLIFASALFGGWVGASLSTADQQPAVVTVASQPSASVGDSSAAPGKLIFSQTEVQTTITSVVEQVKPSVVTVVGVVSGGLTFFGDYQDSQVSGSGFVISADGYILTNNHVIEDASEIHVVFHDSTELPATLVSSDVFADLAVLKVEGNMPAVATLGNSDLLKPGETVIAVGSPLGDFRNSVTVGVISATGRTIDTGEGYQLENLVQTDAAINSGNSGGPLVNLAGEVVGINTLVVRGSGSSAIAEGLGFAIPSNTAIMISEQIIAKGYFARPYLGIQVQTINPRLASMYDLPVEWGAYITQMSSSGPAARAGLRRGDIITRIGPVVIDEDTSYYNALFASQAGQTVELQYVRGSQAITTSVTLGEMTS